MNTKSLVAIIVVVLVVAAAGYLVYSRQGGSKQPEGQPEGGEPSTTGEAEPVNCGDDPPCLLPQFLACNPSEMKMPFIGPDSFFVITVAGSEGGKCRYKSNVIDSQGKALIGGEINCLVPKEILTTDTFGHFFGQDKAPGQEQVRAQQDQIEATYCTKLP